MKGFPLYIYVTDVYARGVNVNLTPLTSNRGALATDATGCSLWRYLLERPPPTWESRVRDPLGTRYELGRCGPGRGCYIGAVTRTGVRFRGVNVTDVYMYVYLCVCGGGAKSLLNSQCHNKIHFISVVNLQFKLMVIRKTMVSEKKCKDNN